MILFRRAPSAYPFVWETAEGQPPGRWHRTDDGPAQYLADTPDGAWAELLRHEGIVDATQLAGIRETLWAVEVAEDVRPSEPQLERRILTGDVDSYPACRVEAARLRAAGAKEIVAPSAALLEGEARGWRVERGLRPGPERDGRVVVLFGPRPDLVAWRAASDGRPDAAPPAKVRHLRARS